MDEAEVAVQETLRVYSPKLRRYVDVELRPTDAPRELYESVGCSNGDYGG